MHIRLFDLIWETTSWLKSTKELVIDTKYINIPSKDVDNNQLVDEAITNYLAVQYNNQLVEWSWELITQETNQNTSMSTKTSRVVKVDDKTYVKTARFGNMKFQVVFNNRKKYDRKRQMPIEQ